MYGKRSKHNSRSSPAKQPSLLVLLQRESCMPIFRFICSFSDVNEELLSRESCMIVPISHHSIIIHHVELFYCWALHYYSRIPCFLSYHVSKTISLQKKDYCQKLYLSNDADFLYVWLLVVYFVFGFVVCLLYVLVHCGGQTVRHRRSSVPLLSSTLKH